MEWFRIMAGLLKWGSEMDSPTPSEIIAQRKAAALTQTEAGELIYTAIRTWQQWEKGDRKMHPALWELFRIKAGQIADIKEL